VGKVCQLGCDWIILKIRFKYNYKFLKDLSLITLKDKTLLYTNWKKLNWEIII